MANLNVGVWKENDKDIKGARENKKNEDKIKDKNIQKDMKKK
jgi:hypothetical protein